MVCLGHCPTAALLALLFAAIHGTHANREEKKRKFGAAAALFTQERRTDYEYGCCLDEMLPEEGTDEPKASAINVVGDNGKLKKCILTAVPTKCAKTPTACDAECKEIFKTSIEWYDLRIGEQTKAVENAQKEKEKQLKQIQDDSDKTTSETQTTYDDALSAADKKFHDDVDSIETALKDAEDLKEVLRKKIKELEESLEKTKSDLTKAEEEADTKTKELETTKTSATKEKEEAEHAAESAKQASTESEKESTDKLKAEAEALPEKQQETLDQLEKKRKELAADDVNIRRESRKAACWAKDKGQDCCCSVPIYESDADKEPFQIVPMCVSGSKFVNWDVCFGAKPYAKTSTWTMERPCKFQQLCPKCRDLICKSEAGHQGVCPSK